MCTVCLVACGSRSASKQRQAETPTPPARYGFNIINTYPHDPAAYTQGLFWYEGELYESTGEYGRSTLRRVELETGEVVQKIDLPNDVFGEGSVLLGGKIYLLTWLEGKCLVYDPVTFEKTGEFPYKGEGWGLTTDGTKLYMSDGTANITVRNPATFAEESTIVVRNEDSILPYINELEWIDGRIWANVYTTMQVVIINPADGQVEGIIDFSGIESQRALTPTTDVMNGIAQDPATGKIYVTGKNWDKLFEIEIVKK
jgi:glutamine cyclotransferase